MRAGQVMVATRLGFFVAAGLLGAVILLRHRFDGDEPGSWATVAVPLLIVSAALVALATMALSYRIVTGKHLEWWQYLLALVPCVQFFALLGFFRELRDASPSARTKAQLDRAVILIFLAALATAFRWDAEVVVAGQGLVMVGAWLYVVAVLPMGPRSVGGDGDVERVGSAGAG